MATNAVVKPAMPIGGCGHEGEPSCPPQPCDGVAYTRAEMIAYAVAVRAETLALAKTAKA